MIGSLAALRKRGPFELTVALRYFRSTRQDALIRLLSRITAGGLALGVAALILALAALSGFQHRLLEEVRLRTPALQARLVGSADVEALRSLAAGVPGVASSQVVVYGAGWLHRHGEVLAVDLVGYEQRLPGWLPGAEGGAGDGADGGAKRGLWLAAERVQRWQLEPGAVVEVVTPRVTLTPLGPQPRSRRLPLAGSFDAGTADDRHAAQVALPLDLAQSLVGDADRWLDIELARGADDVRVARGLEAAARSRPELGGLELRSWRDVHRALLFVLRLEKSAVFVAVVLIVLVASFALVAALSLILASKQAEVGILGALGAAPKRLRRVFLLLGGMLAVSGTAGGGALGTVVAVILDRSRLLRLPGDVYIVDHVPFLVRGFDLAVVLASTVAVTLLAAFVGARRVGAISPIEAIRR